MKIINIEEFKLAIVPISRQNRGNRESPVKRAGQLIYSGQSVLFFGLWNSAFISILILTKPKRSWLN
jgi:hypothetical protein